MASQDLQALIEKSLRGDTLIACIGDPQWLEVSKLEGWVRSTRYLALVAGSTSGGNGGRALLVLSSSGQVPIQHLYIEPPLIPVNSDFTFTLDTESKLEEGSDLYLNISWKKHRLLFEMTPSTKSNAFVVELYRAVDTVVKKTSRGLVLLKEDEEFAWLSKYPEHVADEMDDADEKSGVDGMDDDLTSGSSTTHHLEFEEEDDLTVPRESIARGSTPIAARESAIRYQMARAEPHYIYTQPIRVFVGSWNVNGQAAGSVQLADWLACDIDPPDIYAIGFQELDLSKEAFLFNETPREEEWYGAVWRGLHNGAKYCRVRTVRLVGMMLTVFVQKKHMEYVRGISSDTVGTGIMGKMGNKGGVSVRFELHKTSFCFVNAHLAAHVDEYERRNQDFRDIYGRTVFTLPGRPPKAIKDHDQIFWLGDLNYRITEVETRQAKDWIDREEYKKVLEYDQLIRGQRLGHMLTGFKEGPITFKPTYKYDPGTDNWDSSEKTRAPAWCDRVLWKGEGIEQAEYRSHPILRISDHKPVSALFTSKIRIIDPVKYRKIHEEVMKKLDKLENEFLPQVTVETTEINFETVQFLVPQSKTFIIANTGQVPVKFEFIKKLNDPNYCKEWLKIEPYLGSVYPGEKCEIKVEVRVDKKSAYKLNSGLDQLYDILILHLEGGKDIFITVTGTYERSCFGTSLETLASIKEPIREFSPGLIIEREKRKDSEVQTENTYAVPKEVWFLVDHLYRYGTKSKHLFVQPGLHTEIYQIRDWLDNGSQESLLAGSVYSVAEALLLLLDSSPQPLIPFDKHALCLLSAPNYSQCKQIISGLSYHRRNTFIYLCAFLRELLTHSEDNGLDVKTLSTLFGGIFLRQREEATDRPLGRATHHQLDRKRSTFLSHFLTNDDILADLLPVPVIL